MYGIRPLAQAEAGTDGLVQKLTSPAGAPLTGMHAEIGPGMLVRLHDSWDHAGWEHGLSEADCTTIWNAWLSKGNAGLQTVGTALAIYGVAAPAAAAIESRLSSAAMSEAGAAGAGERLAVNEAAAAERTALRGGGCFTAGTMIRTAHGDKPIEQVKAGEKVLSADPKTGKQSYQRVEKTYVRQVIEIVVITLADGRRIETTGEHPFWVEGKGFVPAKSLARSDLLRDADGHRVALASLTYRHGHFTVYNFTVKRTHTYYAAGVWVHNVVCLHGVQPDWAVKGAHVTSEGVELSIRPGEDGSIVFKPFFGGEDPAAVKVATKAAEAWLEHPGNRARLLEQVEKSVPFVRHYPTEGGIGRSAELHFLKRALERMGE